MSTSLEWRKFLCITILPSIADCSERVLGEKVGGVLQKMHEDKGIKFHMNASVESAEASSSLSSHVGSIKLKGGKRIPADVVIMGVGVGPATEFLKESGGFNLEKDGSLTVDKHMRVKGVEDVYATGIALSCKTYSRRYCNVPVFSTKREASPNRALGCCYKPRSRGRKSYSQRRLIRRYLYISVLS